MLPLLKTLFDITLLRRGPGDLPRSVLLLILCIALWLLVALAALAMIDRFDAIDLLFEILSAMIGVLSYAMLVIVSKQTARLVQTLSAIIGCGALLSCIFVVVYALLQPFLGSLPMDLIAWAYLLWSISVKGHIIASAINRHWYVGLIVAVFVFSLQGVVNTLLRSLT